jgi:hypothetical protein
MGMTAFMQNHKKLSITVIAVFLAVALGVTAYIVFRPAPGPLLGAAGEFADAADADDWGMLPRDAAGAPIGEPEMPLDEAGEPIIRAGQATEKRSADEPLPIVSIPENTDKAAILDTTAETSSQLSLVLESANPGVKVTPDSCLLDWARTTLLTSDGDTFSGVRGDVCGRDAAVMFGGYSTSVYDLGLHAQYTPEEKTRVALGKVLLKNDMLSYASVATADGKAVMMVVAAADGSTNSDDADEPKDADEAESDEEPILSPDYDPADWVQ